MKLNTFRKYFLMISVLFLLCLTFIVIILSVLMNNYLSKDKFETMGVVCDAVSRYASVDYRSSGFKRNMFNISRAVSATENDTLIVFINSDNETICCTCEDYAVKNTCRHTENSFPADFLKKTENGRVNEVTWMGSVFTELNYVTAQRVQNVVDSSLIGYVIVASAASSLTGFLGELAKIYLFSAVVPVAVMFFVLYFVTRRWNKPIVLMSEAAKAMAKGDFSKRIPVTSDDEIGALAKSFNQMTNSLVELENMRRGFIANVSHELRTPMTTIGGFIDGIIDGTIEGEQHQHYLKIVSNEVKRLTRLVQTMLSLSKLEAGEIKIQPTDFDFRKLVLEIVISQEQRIESRKLNIVGLDTLESYNLYADRDLIYQAVYNLCDNAIKFTNEGGTISFSAIREGNMLNFKIRNTGIGIPEKDLSFVFDRFYKGDKSRSQVKDSTGLGLYIVKTIVKIHHGAVFVSSKENEYTEFGVSLPYEV